jgi:endonuclease/exonuclease/phosphatase family metal-dependent hydrolase
MAGTYRLILKRSFIFLNSLTAVLFLLTCLSPYLNPSQWWFFSILGLGFAFILVLLFGFLLFWLFVSPRYMLISLIVLGIGWKSLVSFFGFDLSGTYDPSKEKGTLRLASWNVARFIELKRNNNKGSQTRLKMLDLIKAQKADVLCLQEFFHSTDSTLYNNIDYFKKKLGYPYYYFCWDSDGGQQWFGQIIFSRFPIVDSGKITYPRPSQAESLIYADVLYRGDTIRFYTTHLQSVQFKKQDYERIEEIKNREDSILENSKSIFAKLKRAIIYRSRQANLVRDITRQSPHPYVITGDFNDVPNSFTYFTIRGDLQDAFLEKGFGIGRTYSGLSPTLRIDYILPTNDFTVKQFNRVVRDYSDHYLLVADLRLNK